jgi:CheY-like chemotaxis protein
MNKKPKILVVDDDTLFLHMTQQLLESKLECEIHTADNVPAGYEIAVSIIPDIIISDLRMPG